MKPQPDLDGLLDRAEQAARRGELWRAKEMLQGAIRAGRYDPALCERLGVVLLRMGDLVEAGKYLFLSGAREPFYEEPIRIYVRRYTAKAARQPLQLYYTFPRAARLAHRHDYPAIVAGELARLGLPEKLPARHERRGAASGLSGANKMIGLGCLIFIVAVLGLAVIGLVTILQWVRSP
jgi:hypothetical protein